jgi:hypothetical protein
VVTGVGFGKQLSRGSMAAQGGLTRDGAFVGSDVLFLTPGERVVRPDAWCSCILVCVALHSLSCAVETGART